MTAQDKYTRTAFNWLMAVAVGSRIYQNLVSGKRDLTDFWSFTTADNTDIETWLEGAAEIIKEYYEGNPCEVAK